MGQIAFLLDDFGSDKATTVTDIRTASGISMSDVIQAVAEKRPVLVRRLFDRKDPAFPQRLLQLLAALEGRHQSYRAYELLDGEEFDPLKADKYYTLTAERLRNMIEARSKSLDEQRRLARLQDGVDE